VGQGGLSPAENDDKEVKPVKHGSEVSLKADSIHLDEHLKREECDEEHVGNVYSTNIQECIKTHRRP